MVDSFPSASPALIEIAAVDNRIRHIGKIRSVRSRWLLSGEELCAQIGSDDECRVVHKKSGLNLFDAPPPVKKDLLEAVFRSAKDQLADYPIFDGGAVELNLTPGAPLEIVKTFGELDAKASSVFRKFGWSFHMGAGHWHFSLEDTGHEGLRRVPLSTDIAVNNHVAGPVFSPLAYRFAGNLVALQRLVPALFLRPSRSEKRPRNAGLTRRLGAGEDDREITVRMNGCVAYKNGSPKFELRMAHLAPEVPVLMLLHAAERTLQGDIIKTSHYRADVVDLGKANDEAIFVRGLGAYFRYIETTDQSGYLDRHFPQLKANLIERCRHSYRDFLGDATRSSSYTNRQRQIVLTGLRQSASSADVLNALSSAARPEPPKGSVRPNFVPPRPLQAGAPYRL